MNLILYDNIQDKNRIEAKTVRYLSSHESLVHTLNLMDFMAVFKKREIPELDNNIKWIELERNRHDIQ